MFQLGNLYTGKLSNIPKNLSVNHLYYAYDTRELYSFTSGGSPVSIISSGGTSEKKHEFISPFSYCGTAPSGSLTSANVWNIKRIEVFDDGTTNIKSATGVAWDNRLTLIYT